MSEQCESCLGYTDENLTLVCKECVEKAAGYDLLWMQKKRLENSATRVLELLNEIGSIDDLPRVIGAINSTVYGALDYCKPPKKVELGSNEKAI